MSPKAIRKHLTHLRDDTNGVSMALMAFAMPVLIGTAGMAVDFAQWYMWKRELQYAVDQAAIAGAWAKAEPATADTYDMRAKQEFDSNISILNGITTVPTVELADFGIGNDNSVVVTSSATKSLPFSTMIMQKSVTVRASATATFEAATNWTTCVLAVDPDDSDSLIIGGTASGDIACGMGALSTAGQAIRKNGNPGLKVSDIIAAGGIDSGLASNGNLHPFISNLSDPYSELSPPSSTTPRTYECPTGSTTTVGGATADIKTVTATSYTYWQGKNQNQANTQVTYTGAGSQTGGSTNAFAYGQTVSASMQNGYNELVSSTDSWTGQNWPATSGKEKIYEKKTVAINKIYSNVTVLTTTTPGASGTADNLLPGTYGNISIACNTHFSPGVYVITGTLDMGQNKLVTGSDVLLVFAGSGTEKFKLNAKSEMRMSGITAATLTSKYGMSAEEADALDGMLIFDPNSTADVKINGSSTMVMEGIIYMPKRTAKFNGNSSVSGKCMMLAAGKLEFTGTNDLASFCIPPDIEAFDVGGTTISIRLVA